MPPQIGLRARMFDEEVPEFAPQLLTQLEDELARSRMREAFWISVVCHIVLVLLVVFSPQWLPNWAQPHLLRAEDLARTKEPTYLALPHDLQKPPERVHSNKLSDKNRIAETTHPQIDKRMLETLREEAHLRGKHPGPPSAAPGPPRQESMQPGLGQQFIQPGLPQQQQRSQSAMNNVPQPRVQSQDQPQNNYLFKTPGSAGAAVAQAARNAPRTGGVRMGSFGAGGGGSGGGGGGFGSMDRNARMGAFDVLSDTQGVDFGPYLSRVLQSIKFNWYNLIPEEARPPLLKHGKVGIRFLITSNGRVAGMYIESPSGDIPLDRAAYGGITASDPFSPLPHDFHGPYLALRITFFYNPRLGELD